MIKNKRLFGGLIGLLLVLQSSITAQNTFSVGSNAQLTLNGTVHLVLNQFNLANYGTITPGTSTIHFKGSGNNSLLSGGTAWYNLNLDKQGSGTVSILDDLFFSNNLNFAASNSFLQLDDFDLSIAANATITGYDTDNYVITNATGQLIKQEMEDFTFPVGFDATSYNPLMLEELLTVDNIGVKCMENAMSQGMTGSPLTADVIDASWIVTEEIEGGSNLRIMAQWSTSDETTNFDRTQSGIAFWSDTFQRWMVAHDSTQIASGSEPYQVDQYNFNKLGVFSVMDDAYELSGLASLRVKVMLQGAYDNGATLMRDDLRSTTPTPLIPNLEPYGGNAAIKKPSDILADLAANSIVDWVEVELRRADFTVVASKPALLQRDGDVVAPDGTSPVEFIFVDPLIPYHVVVKHRNHLGVMTQDPIDFSGN